MIQKVETLITKYTSEIVLLSSLLNENVLGASERNNFIGEWKILRKVVKDLKKLITKTHKDNSFM